MIHLKTNNIYSLICKKAFLIILFAFLLCASIFPQSNNEIVAAIGNKSISVDEFVARYELTPQLFREQKNVTQELKLEFIYTLIAEKLLASYGESIFLDTSDLVKKTLKNFEEMFVRDELYNQMVANKAVPKADSLLGFYLANATTVKCNYITTNSYEEAARIFDLLERGVPFDYFASGSTLNLGDTLAVTFGQFNEPIENEILTLPENGFTRPIQLEDEWYILKVAVKYYPILERSIGWETEYKRLSKLAKERAEVVFYTDYMKKLFGNFNVKANGKLLKTLSYEVFDLLERKKQSRGEQKKYFLEAADIALLTQLINQDYMSMVYFTLPNESVRFKDFLHYLRFENTSFDTIDQQKVFEVLNGKTRKFIEHKVLANEGFKYGLDKNKSVQEKFDMWKQNYYYQLVLSEFADSAALTDEEIKAYYNQLFGGQYKIKEAKIIEIITATLDDAEKVINRLEMGTDIIELAKLYSTKYKTDVLESEFKPISEFKEVGYVIDKMQIGEIYGPIKVADGYSIFKLMDRREDSAYNTKSFEQIREQYGQEIRYLKKKDSINQFIAKLASENNVTINNELLKNIKTTRHNAVVFHLLGFGGKLTAVPLIAPNSEWVNKWLESLKVTP